MRSPEFFIAACASWSDFWERAKRLPTDREKGATFERLTQLYLQTTPEYQTELRDVWTLPEVPSDVRRRLNLPARDEGIDLIDVEKPWLPPHAFAPNPCNPMESEMLPIDQVFRTVQLLTC